MPRARWWRARPRRRRRPDAPWRERAAYRAAGVPLKAAFGLAQRLSPAHPLAPATGKWEDRATALLLGEAPVELVEAAQLVAVF